MTLQLMLSTFLLLENETWKLLSDNCKWGKRNETVVSAEFTHFPSLLSLPCSTGLHNSITPQKKSNKEMRLWFHPELYFIDLTGLLDHAIGAVKISLEAKEHNTWWRVFVLFLFVLFCFVLLFLIFFYAFIFPKINSHSQPVLINSSMAKMHCLYQRQSSTFLKDGCTEASIFQSPTTTLLRTMASVPCAAQGTLAPLSSHGVNILGSSIKRFYEMLSQNTSGSSLGYHVSLESSEPCDCSLREQKGGQVQTGAQVRPIQLIQVSQY